VQLKYSLLYARVSLGVRLALQCAVQEMSCV